MTFARFALSEPEILDYAAESRSLRVAAYSPQAVAFAGGVDSPERMPAVRVTADVFSLLETPPLRGRTLTPDDGRPGAPCAVVLSHALWRERMGAAETAVGESVRINGAPCRVAGVMPAGFSFPTPAARLWLPLQLERNPNTRGNHGLLAVGRLASGATIDSARREMATIMTRWAQSLPHHKGHGLVAVPLKDDLVRPVADELNVLTVGVSLLLVGIAANLSSLLLAHGHARRRELAVRAALGATRGSLARQVLFEGWWLAAAGGFAGGAIVWLVLDPVIAAYPAALPRANEVQAGWRMAALTGALSLMVGTLVSIVPAVRLSRGLDAANLNGGRRTALPLSLRVERALVVGELAVGLAVTVGALLLTQAFVGLSRVPLGFNPSDVTAGIVGIAGPTARQPGAAQRFFADLTARVAASPGVGAAGALSTMPMVGVPPADFFTIEGRPVTPPSRSVVVADYVMVTPGAFQALRIDVLRGRGITSDDVDGAPPVAVINATLARQHWGDENPIGRRIRYPEAAEADQWTAWGPWLTVVGVVSDIRTISPAAPPRPAIYVSHAQRPRSAYEGQSMGVVVRALRDTADADVALRAAVRALDPGASLSTVRTMDALVGAAVARPRFMSAIMSVYAAIALAVAALGVYGVVAFAVERRTRDIGVRMALGATRTRIAGQIVRHSATLLAGGLGAGLVTALWLAGAMRSMLFGVSPYQPAPYLAVSGALAVVVGLAAAWPARRAMHVDPLTALRSE
jgi:predicted permease